MHGSGGTGGRPWLLYYHKALREPAYYILMTHRAKCLYRVVLFGESTTVCVPLVVLKYMQVSVRSGSSRSGSKSLTSMPKRKVNMFRARMLHSFALGSWLNGFVIPYIDYYRKLCLPNR